MCAASRLSADSKSQDSGRVTKIKVERSIPRGYWGSHGSPKAIILGLMGEKPETMSQYRSKNFKVKLEGSLLLNGEHSVEFDVRRDLILHRKKSPLITQTE